VRAGPQYELLATNPSGRLLMATPAIANGMLLIRGTRDLWAVN
jgi:hypothetical protein